MITGAIAGYFPALAPPIVDGPGVRLYRLCGYCATVKPYPVAFRNPRGRVTKKCRACSRAIYGDCGPRSAAKYRARQAARLEQIAARAA